MTNHYIVHCEFSRPAARGVRNSLIVAGALLLSAPALGQTYQLPLPSAQERELDRLRGEMRVQETYQQQQLDALRIEQQWQADKLRIEQQFMQNELDRLRIFGR